MSNRVSLFDSDEFCFVLFFNQQMEFVCFFISLAFSDLRCLLFLEAGLVFFMPHEAPSQSWSGCQTGPRLLLHCLFWCCCKLSKSTKIIYNCPPPYPGVPAERCDRNELQQATLTFCLLFLPESRRNFLDVRGWSAALELQLIL